MKSKFQPDENGYFGQFGGAFIPELLHPNVKELADNYIQIIESEAFQTEYKSLLKDFVGRPTPLYLAKRLSEKYGATIYLKREDLNHTGAHKVNNTVGQILIAKKLGKTKIIAETGAGQHGVATATVCALMGLECTVFMGEKDIVRQAPNVARMKMLGFSNRTTTNLIDKNEPNLELHDLMRQFTRQIVQGKSKDFDASQIILVCGSERSGKTLLSKKLSKFLPTHTAAQNSTLILQNNRVISDPLSGDLNSLFKSNSDANVTSLFRKRQDIVLDGSRLIVDYEGPMDVLNSVIMRLESLEHKPKVSVIYALEVGKSYNAVRQALEIPQIPNLSVALTKMDLLEVSISELSALYDLGRKIQFFSGLKILEDGLDFAKISVVEDFLLNIVEQEGL